MPPRSSKTFACGILCDSMAEANYLMQLEGRKRLGEITDYQHHPMFPLVVNGFEVGRYTGDFLVRYPDQHASIEIIEVKGGPASRDFPVRWKLAQVLYPDYRFTLVGGTSTPRVPKYVGRDLKGPICA